MAAARMAQPKDRLVEAAGPLTIAGAVSPADDNKYIGHFSSDLGLCGETVGTFVNDVRCRKWTDLSGQYANTACYVATGPGQPDRGSIVNIGHITIDISGDAPPRKVVCEEFQLTGVQTYGVEAVDLSGNVQTVFLFTGKGQGMSTPDNKKVTVTGVGKCLEEMHPFGAPTAKSWTFVFMICKAS